MTESAFSIAPQHRRDLEPHCFGAVWPTDRPGAGVKTRNTDAGTRSVNLNLYQFMRQRSILLYHRSVAWSVLCTNYDIDDKYSAVWD
jgi:hypothetical protein